MSGALSTAAIGLRAQQLALEAVANNIANVNTDGFKRTAISFGEIVERRADLFGSNAVVSDAVEGVALLQTAMLSEQGEIQRTERVLDIAIDGSGLIELMGPSGRTYFWRGGALRVLPDGSLASPQGWPLRADIQIPEEAAEILIGPDGTVTARTEDEPTGREIGQIMLTRLPSEDLFRSADGGLYEARDGIVPREAMPGEDGMGTLVQGAIERSNVSLNEEMVRLLVIQRAYAANAQVAQAADQLMGIANNLRRS